MYHINQLFFIDLCVSAYKYTNRPYYYDLVPSDYHLFRFLQNWLNYVNFNLEWEVENHLFKFLNKSDKDLYEYGIMELPKR